MILPVPVDAGPPDDDDSLCASVELLSSSKVIVEDPDVGEAVVVPLEVSLSSPVPEVSERAEVVVVLSVLGASNDVVELVVHGKGST